MATLTVGDLEDTLVERLGRRAAANGRSAEDEHREILRTVLGEGEWQETQRAAADRFDTFRAGIAGNGPIDSGALLREVREARLRQLLGDGR